MIGALLGGLYFVTSFGLAVYGTYCLYLLYRFSRDAKTHRALQADVMRSFTASDRSTWPWVTTQIPLFNEADVAERVIRSVAAMRYPQGRHEIQVLDDSTDETRDVVDRVASELREHGTEIQVLRRNNRDGYKAGALANGLSQARGEFIAIFDADFVPPPEFLEQAVALALADSTVGCVQGRWEHLNRDENWLTRAQSLGIDTHFAIQQSVRSWSRAFLNFNGTAGIWRRKAIEDAGGWSADTLTEDLDLSYRAQLRGWRIEFCMDLPCPGEIPNTASALKNQQHRWAQGSAQTAKKMLLPLWQSEYPFRVKILGTIHLTAYSMSWLMLLFPLVSYPLTQAWSDNGWMRTVWFPVMLFNCMTPCLLQAAAASALHRSKAWAWIPVSMMIGFGLCLNNAIAVAKGYWGAHSPVFVRTPKSGSRGEWRRTSRYTTGKSMQWILELVLGGYCVYVFWSSAMLFNGWAGGFMLLYSAGFLSIALGSMPRWRQSPDRVASLQACRNECLDREQIVA